MATCNDCIHRTVCVILALPDAFENTKWDKEPCDHFKAADQCRKGYKAGYADGYRKSVADLRNSIDERFHRLVKDILSECEDRNDDKG